MNEKKEYLSEEKYQKTSNSLFFVGIGIIILGIIIAMVIVISKLGLGNKSGSEAFQQQLKIDLEQRYDELKSKGVSESWDYKDKDGYEMFLIDIALNPTYDTCESSSRYVDNDTTREYCKIKAQLNNSFASGSILFTIVPALMALMPCLAIGAMLIMYSKRRNIMAYNVQQVMPVAQEGIEKMAPTVGGAVKEVVKGIKEGLKEEDDNEEEK